jgi:hypothetical protein
MSNVKLVALVAIICCVAAACGSTAKKSSKTADNGSALTGSAEPSGSAAPGSTGVGGSHSSGSVGSGGGGTGGSGSGGAYHPPPGVTSKHLAATGPGITNSTIYIGIGYSSQAAAGDRALGGAGAAPSYDTRNVVNSIIDYTNKHGGYAGRVLKPLYVDIKVTEDVPTQEQAACAYWTQDHKVFAMNGGNDVLDTCAEKAHAIPLGAGSAVESTFKKYPHLIDPDSIATDRFGAVTVAGLAAGGYYAGKLGLVTWDDPQYRAAITTGYLPALDKVHVKPLQIAYVAVPDALGSVGDMTAQIGSYVAKFKALGIDHVMIVDGPAGVFSGDGLTFEWEQNAKSQKYYPRYGGNSRNAPGFTINPHDEENNEMVVLGGDSDPANDAGWHANATRQRCFKIEADAGYPVSSSNTNDEGIAASLCDIFFFLQRAINSSTVVTNDAVIAAAEKFGKTYPTAAVYGSNLFPGRHDGGDMVRTAVYLQSCSCLNYKGPPVYVN